LEVHFADDLVHERLVLVIRIHLGEAFADALADFLRLLLVELPGDGKLFFDQTHV
jgi:hypothetical protein